MSGRLTQSAVETLEKSGNPNLRLTQVAREALSGPGNPNIRLTQVAAEILAKGIGIACGNPPHGVVGTAYTTTLPTSGGTPPLVFAVTGGALPPGLALNATTGTISGTPTKPGTYNFTVTVTDSSTAANIKAYAPPPSVSPGGAAAGAASYMGINSLGQQYWSMAVSLETPVSPPGNATGYTVTAQATDQFGNPSPDYFGTERVFFTTNATGSITTTQILLGSYPTTVYTYVTFRAYQNNSDGTTTQVNWWLGGTAQQRVNFGPPPTGAPAPITQPLGAGSVSCAIVVGLGTLAATCGTPPGATAGQPFTYRPPVTIGGMVADKTYDANGTLTWTVTGLPPGLRWDNTVASPTYGSIAGIPTASGSYTYSATILASDSQSVTITCSLPIQIPGGGGTGGGGGGSGPGVCGDVPQAIVGLLWAFQPPFTVGTGLPAPGLWTFRGLPPGIEWDTLSTSPTYGFLVGIPSGVGTYNYTAQYQGATGLVTFACTIVSALPGSAGAGENNQGGQGSGLWLDLWVWRPLFAFAGLNQQIQLPPAYERALRYSLAREFAAFYPARDPAEVTALAVEALLDVDQINTSNAMGVEDAPAPPVPPSAPAG